VAVLDVALRRPAAGIDGELVQLPAVRAVRHGRRVGRAVAARELVVQIEVVEAVVPRPVGVVLVVRAAVPRRLRVAVVVGVLPGQAALVVVAHGRSLHRSAP
jgi:hypothetical protein